MSLVVVTGAGGGIGKASARLLLEQGYQVLGLDLAETSDIEHPNYSYLQVDVTSEESVAALGQVIRAKGETLHGLACCAGIAHSQSLLETSFADWKRLHAVNADGVFLSVREIARIMLEQADKDPQNARSIVVVSSNAGQVPRYEFGAYGASKASALRVASSFGLQLAGNGIRVNTVCPGTTRTPMVTDAWEGQDLASLPIAGSPETFRLGIPLGRIAEPEDIAQVISALLDPKLKHVTMQEITVDGGATF